MPTIAATAAARASVPTAKRLTLGAVEDGWDEEAAPRSDAGIGGMEVVWAVVLELALFSVPPAPCDACCAGAAPVTALVAPCPEAAELTA